MLYREKNNMHTHVPRKKNSREEKGLKKLMPIPNPPSPQKSIDPPRSYYIQVHSVVVTDVETVASVKGKNLQNYFGFALSKLDTRKLLNHS